MNVSNMALAMKSQEPMEAFGGGRGPSLPRFAFAGGFTPDDAAPTCDGLGAVWRSTQELPREQFLLAATAIMEAVWSQSEATDGGHRPVFKTVADLIAAINQGWAYNVNEGDCLFTVFADVRLIERDGQFAGVGTRAPDGAIIHDGRELVAWRERRWRSMRRPVKMVRSLRVV